MLLALLLAAPLQAPTPTHRMLRRPADVPPPELDGVLDDALWAACTPLGELRQVEPVAGAVPSERTEILLAYDDTDLYVGLRCFDGEPAGIRDTQMARDANLDPDDRVEMWFDTFHDHRNAFWFQIGPAGSKGDALITRNGSEFNKRWDTIWYGRARVTEDGWFAECRIPFASINFDPAGGDWGFNTRRFIRRKNEVARWASPAPRLSFFAISSGGTLTGFEDMHQGLGLDVVPFVAGGHRVDDTGEHQEFDGGVDVSYRFTPDVKLSVSLNTDFAETEVDQRLVNLTRFPLFFPEKRKFFLEDSGVFEFGTSNSVVPFFSRRIGLDQDGSTVPLLANLKLTGSTDGYSFGLLNSITDEVADGAHRDLFVGRFSKHVLEQSDVGVIVTRGDPRSSSADTTAGVDVNLRTDEFLGDRNLRFDAYLLRSEDEDSGQADLAYEAGLTYPNDEVTLAANYRVVEDEFDPALGFVQRKGIRQYTATAEYAPRLYGDVRQLRFRATPAYTTSGGREQSASLSLLPLGVEWESGEQLSLRVTPQREVLDAPFEISDGVEIPVGTHDFLRYGASLSTSDKRPFSAAVDVTTGTFYDGWRHDYAIGLEWRSSKYALFDLSYALNDVDLPAGHFVVDVVEARADLLFHSRLSWSNLAQWDDVSDQLGWNSRLRYILAPGRDLFVVLNQGWSTFGDRFAPQATDLRFKVAYTVRF